MNKWIKPINKEIVLNKLHNTQLMLNNWGGFKYKNSTFIKTLESSRNMDINYVLSYNLAFYIINNAEWIIVKFDYSSALEKHEALTFSTNMCISCDNNINSITSYLQNTFFQVEVNYKITISQLAILIHLCLLFETHFYIVSENIYFYVNDGFIDIVTNINTKIKEIDNMIKKLNKNPYSLPE